MVLLLLTWPMDQERGCAARAFISRSTALIRPVGSFVFVSLGTSTCSTGCRERRRATSGSCAKKAAGEDMEDKEANDA
jgi:hypothetical protein